MGSKLIAFVTAVGGGTLRDVLIDVPVFWMYDLRFVYVIAGASVLAILFRKKLGYIRKSLFLFDTIGIALYTVIGVEKGITAGFSPIISISLGVMSACFGGVIRDILSGEIPIIFRKEVYATACIAGAVTYFLLLNTPLNNNFVVFISGGIVILIRLLAVVFKLQLPTIYNTEELGE